MELGPMPQSDGTASPSLHYRTYLPPGIRILTAVAVVTALFPLYLLAMEAGTPSYVALPTVVTVSVLVANLFLSREVVLSADGRLTATGLGHRIDVDVQSITEISLSTTARKGFGFARVRWDGGGFRLWQAMTYLPKPQPRRRKSQSAEAQDFRDLVYRLYLINPAVRIHGIEPPAWAFQAATPPEAIR